MKGIKYEIRLGKPNWPIDEPNGPMSTSPKKVEPILRVAPLTGRRPELAHHVSRNLFYKHERLAPQGKEAGPHHYKKAPTPSQKGTCN